jgi:hypothetical protein
MPTAQRDSADDALTTAHNIILLVLGVQEERFKIPDLREQLEVCKQDLMDILKSKTAARQAGDGS